MKKQSLFWLSLLGMGVVIFIMNALTPLLADDYRYALHFATGEKLMHFADIPASLQAHASLVNGRYVPHAFVQAFTLLPSWVFDVCNSCCYLTLIIGIVRLSTGQIRTSLSFLWLIMGALFLLPTAFGQCMLWLSGSLNYLWCVTLGVWLITPFVDAVLNRQKQLSKGKVCALLVGAFAFGNMSENVAVAFGLLMGFCVVYLWCTKQKTPWWMLVCPVLVLAGWLVLMLSPANVEHMGRTATIMGEYVVRFSQVMTQFLKNSFWLWLVYALLVGTSQGIDKKYLWLSGAFMFFAFVGNVMMTLSHYNPDRAFLGSLILMLSACAMVLHARGQLSIQKGVALFLALWVGLQALGALPSLYTRYALAEGRAKEAMETVQRGDTTLSTYCIMGQTQYDAYTGLIELTDEVDSFLNQSFAQYYGLSQVWISYLQ